MVYHYSDGTLEYEEHFNASSVLQEVLKYFYDTDGNVEYLLYKDNSITNSNTFDLYYYVRNTVGDITELFQVRQQSGSTTTVVNQLASHYEYDPYGNILSVNTYNNDNIGNINPIRYKDYYYDAQTGWYQLSSRFYDPETGKFLNADDVSLITETDSNVVDKNLYAYCDGNPVMRKDDGGQCWQIAAAIIGGVIGAAFEAAQEYNDTGHIDIGQVAIAGGTGALSAALGPVSGALISAAGTMAQELLETKSSGNKITLGVVRSATINAGVSAGLSLVCGSVSLGEGQIAKKAANSAGSYLKKATSFTYKSTISKLKSTANYFKKSLNIKKYSKYSKRKLFYSVYSSFHTGMNYWIYHKATN